MEGSKTNWKKIDSHTRLDFRYTGNEGKYIKVIPSDTMDAEKDGNIYIPKGVESLTVQRYRSGSETREVHIFMKDEKGTQELLKLSPALYNSFVRNLLEDEDLELVDKTEDIYTGKPRLRGSWRITGINVRKLFREKEDRGKPGRYLVELPEGTDKITIMANGVKGSSLLLERRSDSDRFSPSNMERVYFENTSPETFEEHFNSFGFMKKIS